MKRVTVLGAGPSGLMAAWAALEHGADVAIWDRDGAAALDRVRSGQVSAGVLLLHDHCNIPGVASNRRMVHYTVLGQDVQSDEQLAADYQMKVYGHVLDHPPSFIKYHGLREEWDGVGAVATLSHIVEPLIRRHPIDRLADQFGFVQSKRSSDLIISTIPLSVYLPDLPSVPVWVDNRAAPEHESYVWYVPHPHLPWYRVSAAFGRFTAEYAGEYGHDHRMVQKPLPPPRSAAQWMEDHPGVLFTGRMGAWDQHLELHTTYGQVAEALA